jgi:ABC-2 type transport system ATP-binding protein
MLVASGVRKRYGDVVALDGVDLTIGEGEIVGLLGPNGAGKTTLVSIIAGLRSLDEGEVTVGGIDVVRDPGAARRLIGIAPQDLGFYPILSVARNLEFFAEMVGMSRAARRDAIEQVAGTLGLTSLLGRTAGTLSGGQKRRLHSAIALLHRPHLLLLDEPTAGADPASRIELLGLVRQLALEGSAVCYTTHYLPEIEALAARVVVLSHGQTVADARADELVERHGGASVARLTFDGALDPQLPFGGGWSVHGSAVQFEGDDSANAAATLLERLPTGVRARLVSMDIQRPSLETAYLALTGEPAGSETAGAVEPAIP